MGCVCPKNSCSVCRWRFDWDCSASDCCKSEDGQGCCTACCLNCCITPAVSPTDADKEDGVVTTQPKSSSPQPEDGVTTTDVEPFEGGQAEGGAGEGAEGGQEATEGGQEKAVDDQATSDSGRETAMEGADGDAPASESAEKTTESKA